MAFVDRAMDDVGRDALSELTAEMAWVRRLARSLLRDDDAEDLAHEAMIVAAERPPEDQRPLRPGSRA
jgi:DNA-directed RNA polymerase specialized sigma24 family protein